MANLNKVMLMGNLTRDVEVRFLPSNQAVANIGIAVNRRWRSPEGEEREEVTYVDCEAWGKTAETMGKYLSKGRPVFIEGRLKLDTWQDKTDGSNRSKMKVVVENFQFIDSKAGAGSGAGGGRGGDDGSGDSGSGGGAGGGGGRVQTRTGSRPAAANTGSGNSGRPSAPAPEHIDEDDIPF